MNIELKTIPAQDLETMQVVKPNALTLIRRMVENQNQLNLASYSDQWVAKGMSKEFDYNLAASQEIAEFINSYGYSWWSKEPQDLSNCRMEIVDAVHFMLSQSIIDAHAQGTEGASTCINKAYEITQVMNFKDFRPLPLAKLLTARLNISNMNVLPGSLADYPAWTFLFAMAASIGFGLEALFTRYMAKSTLNAFRQKKGYRNGVCKFGYAGGNKYLKLWDGVKQDNDFMSEWLDSLNFNPDVGTINHWLEEKYFEAFAASETQYASKTTLSDDEKSAV